MDLIIKAEEIISSQANDAEAFFDPSDDKSTGTHILQDSDGIKHLNNHE